MTLSKKPRRDTSRAAVGEAIRQGIQRGDLVSGQRLVETELCEALGASRGNVRAALMDLVHKGLLEHIPNRGARVRVVSLEEALQLAEVRMAVESLCVARAAERITDQQIDSLRAIAVRMKDRAKDGDAFGFAELTHDVFDMYVGIADQPVARDVLERLRALNSRHRFRLSYRADRARVALPYWLEIIDAICNRDPDAARQALHRHSHNVQEAMKALVDDHRLLASK